MQTSLKGVIPGRFESLLWQDATAPAVQLQGPGRTRSWVRAAIEHRAAQYLAAGVLPERATAVAIGRGSPVDTLALCWLALAHGHPLTDPHRAELVLSASDQIPGSVKPTTYSVKSRVHPEVVALRLPEGDITHRELAERLDQDPQWAPISPAVAQALRVLATGAPWVVVARGLQAMPLRGSMAPKSDKIFSAA